MILGHDIPRPGASAAPLSAAEIDAAAARVREMALTDVRGALSHAATLLERVPAGAAPRARLLAARAHALCYANQFAEAVAHLEEARNIAESHGQLNELGPLWLTQVQPLARLGRLPEAARAAERAREAFTACGQPAMAAKAGVNLGIVLRMTGRALDALGCFDQAAADLPPEPLSAGMLASNRAEALLDLDRYDEARHAFEAALDLLASAGHSHAAAVVEGNLADLLSRTGEIDAALPRFDRAVAGLEKAGAEADAARLLAEEADALLAAGAHHKSRRLFEKAIPVLKRAGLTREACRALIGAGIARMKVGDHPGAAANLNEGVAAAAQCGAGPLLSEARLALAELALAAGDLERARALARAAQNGTEAGPVFDLRAEAVLASIDLRADDPDAALRRLDQALARAEPLRSSALASRLLHLRGGALAAAGDLAGALRSLKEAIRHAERRRGTIRAEQLRTAYLESSHRLYADAFSTALDAGLPEAVSDAFDAAALLKARTLSEFRASRPPAPEPEDPTDAQYRACVKRLNTLYTSLGPTPKASRADSAALHAELAELEARLDRLHDRRERLGDAAHDSAAQPRSRLDRLIDALTAERAVVVYAADRDHISAIVATDAGATSHRRLAPIDDACALERRIAFEVGRAEAGGRAPSNALLDRVFELFIAPLLEATGPRSLAFVGCPGVHALPLTAANALRGRPGSDAWMIPAPTPTPTPTLPPTPTPPGSDPHAAPRGRPRAVIIGVPDDAAPTAAEEAAAIASLYPDAVLLEADQARAERLLDELPRAELVHFAGHAVFDADFPMSSRLRAADRWVAARELRGRLRPGATVVLSGCETGQMSSGEDRYGLARAFLASGASAVVASLWRLHDAFARRFFASLHAEAAGLPARTPASLAACLGSAQRRHAAQGDPWPLWAGLSVKGVLE